MIKPEQEKEFYRLIGMISKMAVKVNNETTYCVFFTFHGHVDNIDIYVTPSKERYHDKIIDEEFYTVLGDQEGSHKHVSIDDLKRSYRLLSGLLDENVNIAELLRAA